MVTRSQREQGGLTSLPQAFIAIDMIRKQDVTCSDLSFYVSHVITRDKS